jgi:hypothetical protein
VLWFKDPSSFAFCMRSTSRCADGVDGSIEYMAESPLDSVPYEAPMTVAMMSQKDFVVDVRALRTHCGLDHFILAMPQCLLGACTTTRPIAGTEKVSERQR